VPVSINIENGIAAMALAQLNGVAPEEIKEAMATFSGVDRRFDFKVKTADLVFLSDYAHHPQEIKQCAKSLRELYANKKITALFQPHLYTRTRDFYQDFADSLSLFDEVILMDIYPAREEPIPGVNSELIARNMSKAVDVKLCHEEDIMRVVREGRFEVLVSLGAGDMEKYVPQITELFKERCE
jgi:UDP-N-acetylmuramate--alanine ligase